METYLLVYILFALHSIILRITEGIVKTRHRVFWWGFFFTAPIGIIIALLLDIKDSISSNQLKF